MRIYLAGGFYADNWQQKVTNGIIGNTSYDIKEENFFNPKLKERNEDNEIINEIFSNPKVYTEWDLEAISHSDIVFAYIDKGNPAVGVIAEIGYASGLGKRIILVIDPEEEDSFHKDKYFNFLRNMPNVTSFYKLEEGIIYFENILSFYGLKKENKRNVL